MTADGPRAIGVEHDEGCANATSYPLWCVDTGKIGNDRYRVHESEGAAIGDASGEDQVRRCRRVRDCGIVFVGAEFHYGRPADEGEREAARDWFVCEGDETGPHP